MFLRQFLFLVVVLVHDYMIPPRLIIIGDLNTGYFFKKFAFNQLGILEKLKSFQGLKQDVRRVSPIKGVDVECISNFSQRDIIIKIAPGVSISGEAVLEVVAPKYCLCFPHFSYAVILSVFPEYPVQGKDPISGLEINETDEQFDIRVTQYIDNSLDCRFAYDIAICDGSSYIIYLDAKDANYGRYYVGQEVLVTFAKPILTDNCARDCLLDKPRYDFLTISPLHISDGMNEWIES